MKTLHAHSITAPIVDMRRDSGPSKVIPNPTGNRAQRRAWQRATGHTAAADTTPVPDDDRTVDTDPDEEYR